MEHFFEISQKLFSLSIDGLLGLELRLKKEDQPAHLPKDRLWFGSELALWGSTTSL
jgi:hypothetical protein